MDPSQYVPAYLEHCYLQEHADLTDAARALVHDQISLDAKRYATTPHAQALVSYMRVHAALMSGLFRMEELPDDEFERERIKLFSQTREQLHAIVQRDERCIDAQLVSIQLADVPLDACLSDVLQLEQRTRTYLLETRPGFDPEVNGLWRVDAADEQDGAGSQDVASELDTLDSATCTMCDPDVIGWLHTVEALAQGCIFTARYRAAAQYARMVMRAEGYPNLAVGTLLLALARLEDEDAFFEAAREAGEDTEDLPWFLLGRTLLLYKLGQKRSARRALRDFANRCDGGAFFLLNPTFHNPYLPVRPAVGEAWELTHQAVWEADGIISDTPDFATWAEGVESIREISEDFALRHGF